MRNVVFQSLLALLGMAAVWGCGASSSPPPDALTGGPSLVSTSPRDGEKDVPPARPFFVEFSEPMDPNSLHISLTPALTMDTPAWTEGNLVSLVRPLSSMAPATAYEATVDAKTAAGIALHAAFSFATSIDTAAAPPELVGVSPSNGATSVGMNASLSFRFSKPMNPSSVQVTLNPAVTLDSPAWSLGNQVLTLANSVGFAPSTPYAIVVAGSDLDGEPLGGVLTSSFTTTNVRDTGRPTVVLSTPSGGAQNVSLASTVSVLFSESMREAPSQAAFSSQPAIPCAFSWDQEKLLICRPTAPLAPNTPYQVTVSTGAQDAAGNSLAAPFTFSFGSGAGSDGSTPSLLGFSPPAGSTGRGVREPIVLSFSKAMATVATQGAFSIVSPSGVSGLFQWSSGNGQLTFTPTQSFPFRSQVTWQLATGATDSSGNRLAAAAIGNFQVRDCTVQGTISAKYNALGGKGSFLGACTTDEAGTPDGIGRFNHFEHGSIYFTPAIGANEVRGQIHDLWAQLGFERSVLGYPVTDETGTPDGVGRYNHFEHGSIYFAPATGTHEVHGAIRDEWARRGYERSPLGYPTSNEFPIPDGFASDFQHGTIRFFPATGYQVIIN